MIVLLSPTAFAAGESGAIGTVPRLLTATSDHSAMYEECTLGDAMSDAAVRYTGAKLAVINGGDLTGNLQHGVAYDYEIAECIAVDKVIAVCKVTPAQLSEILEAALAHVRTNGNREYDTENAPHPAFPQISGFRISYDPEAEPGQRVARITVDNKSLDLTDTETVFTLAATEQMFQGGYGLPAVEDYTVTDWTLRSLLCRYIQDGMDEYILPGNRIYAMEIHSGLFASRYTIFTIAAIATLFVALLIPFGTKLVSFSSRNVNSMNKEIEKNEKFDSNKEL